MSIFSSVVAALLSFFGSLTGVSPISETATAHDVTTVNYVNTANTANTESTESTDFKIEMLEAASSKSPEGNQMCASFSSHGEHGAIEAVTSANNFIAGTVVSHEDLGNGSAKSFVCFDYSNDEEVQSIAVHDVNGVIEKRFEV